MEQIEIKFKHSAKIWWSLVWRMYVLMIPVMFLMFPIMFFLMPSFEKGTQLSIESGGFFALKFMIVWLTMVLIMIIAQIFAVKWMSKTSWSDFKLVAVKVSSREK